MPFSYGAVTIQLSKATRDELTIVKGVYGLRSYNDAILYLLANDNQNRIDMMSAKEATPDE